MKLKLRARGWGGWRPGAGRKPGPNPRILHRRRKPFRSSHPSHVTLKVRGDVPSLRTLSLVEELQRSFSKIERTDFRLVHYSIQHDHLHGVVEAKDARALGRGMKALASRFARAVNRVFERKGPVLADRYHLHVLKSPREVRNVLAYVLLNGRRHAAKRGVVGRARVDPASSGRWFDGWRRGFEGRRGGPCPVARPHTWLLLVGWRRHGLLDPAEVPG